MNDPQLLVRYSPGSRRFYWLYGLLALLWGAIGLTPDFYPGWIDIAWIAMGLLCFSGYFWHRRTPYLKVEGEILVQPGFPSRKIPLSHLKPVRTFAGDLILESDTAKITLARAAACTRDLEALEEFLENNRTYKKPLKEAHP